MYGFEDAELIVLTLPDNPSGPLQNRKIDATNYHHSITGLYPAFLVAPILKSVKVFQNYKAFNHEIYRARKRNNSKFWPNSSSTLLQVIAILVP